MIEKIKVVYSTNNLVALCVDIGIPYTVYMLGGFMFRQMMALDETIS